MKIWIAAALVAGMVACDSGKDRWRDNPDVSPVDVGRLRRIAQGIDQIPKVPKVTVTGQQPIRSRRLLDDARGGSDITFFEACYEGSVIVVSECGWNYAHSHSVFYKLNPRGEPIPCAQ